MKGNETKYLGIAESIRLKILNKIYKTNDLLPSENSLCHDYGVSRMTIRKAIEVLVNEGYLYSAPGKGTYVKAFSLNKFDVRFSAEEVMVQGFSRVKLLHAKIMAPTIDLVYHLQVAPKTKILCIRCLLFRGEKAIALDEKYMPYFPGMNIKEESFTYNDMQGIIAKENHIYGCKEEIFVTGIFPDESINQYFEENQKKAEFMVLFEQKIFDADEIPMGYGRLVVDSMECRVIGKSRIQGV
ncbi:MAG: GntR family transcriptional regulator [Eubacteriaceae bacterium]